MNFGDDEQAQTKLGSYLALEILESGIIGNMPLIIRSLTACTLELLAQPIAESINLQSRIRNIYSTSVQNVFQSQIDIWLGQQNMNRALPAWMLVLYLEKSYIEWQRQLYASIGHKKQVRLQYYCQLGSVWITLWISLPQID